jgi:hypothetical protein
MFRKLDQSINPDPVSEKLCLLVFYNSRLWAKSTNLMILSVIHHCQSPLDPNFMLCLHVSSIKIKYQQKFVHRYIIIFQSFQKHMFSEEHCKSNHN